LSHEKIAEPCSRAGRPQAALVIPYASLRPLTSTLGVVQMSRATHVTIDLSSVRDPNALHSALSGSLGFPGWYGYNWNAFWDAITGLVEMPEVLELKGWAPFCVSLPGEAEMMRQCLDEMSEQYPQLASRVIHS
jgi:ribonuclease inhibitor